MSEGRPDLNKSLDEYSRDYKEKRRSTREQKRRTETKERKEKNEKKDEIRSVKFVVDGNTKDRLFKLAGVGIQSRDFPSINVKILMKPKEN